MCTASWLREESGYRVFFNRDESRTRPPATPPEIRLGNGVRYLAPQDTEAGGTWLAANELGLTVGLLNLYRAASVVDGEYTSRGHLVAELASAATAGEVDRRLRAADLTAYRPFTVFAVSQKPPTSVWDWDGHRLSQRAEPDRLPITSSALDDRDAGLARKQALDGFRRDGVLTATSLLEFQRSHLPEKGPLSACMHRPEAKTVSLTVVEVEASRVRMLYGDGSACTATLNPTPDLSRRG